MKISNLSLEYKNISVLTNVSIDLESNKIIGLIGPNGSGKSTLFKCMTDLIISYTGIINKNNKRVALHLNQDGFFDNLSGIKNLEFYGNLKENRSCKFSLVPEFNFFEKKIKNMSLGMKQMVSITEALQKDADIYLFDEPFNGLDILHRDILKKHILELKKENKTIIISSHEISVLQSFVDEVVFIKKGSIIFNGKTNELIEKYNDLENAALKLFYE